MKASTLINLFLEREDDLFPDEYRNRKSTGTYVLTRDYIDAKGELLLVKGSKIKILRTDYKGDPQIEVLELSSSRGKLRIGDELVLHMSRKRLHADKIANPKKRDEFDLSGMELIDIMKLPFKNSGPPRRMYHVTTEKLVPLIKEKGLIRNISDRDTSARHSSRDQGFNGVYLANDLQNAIEAVSPSLRDLHAFEVNTSRLSTDKFILDPEFNEMGLIDDREMIDFLKDFNVNDKYLIAIYNGDIPPRLLYHIGPVKR